MPDSSGEFAVEATQASSRLRPARLLGVVAVSLLVGALIHGSPALLALVVIGTALGILGVAWPHPRAKKKLKQQADDALVESDGSHGPKTEYDYGPTQEAQLRQTLVLTVVQAFALAAFAVWSNVTAPPSSKAISSL